MVLNRFFENVVFRPHLLRHAQAPALPPEIVFVDDRVSNVNDVFAHMPIVQELGIPVRCYVYTPPAAAAALLNKNKNAGASSCVSSHPHRPPAATTTTTTTTNNKGEELSPKAKSQVLAIQIRQFLDTHSVLTDHEALDLLLFEEEQRRGAKACPD